MHDTMKYIIAIPDGATDQLSAYPDGKTPLYKADTPWMDRLADSAEVGWAKTVPDTHPPGSDVACLSIFGFDPARVYTGRSPLEAASMGLELGNRVAFRCNLVTLENQAMKEFTAGHISTEEADELIQSLNHSLEDRVVSFHTGVQYRHCMLAPPDWNEVECTPPHDILDQEITPHLPRGNAHQKVIDMMEHSEQVFVNHPVNQKRLAQGKPPATRIWLWGQGTKPQLSTFQDRYGLRGGVISAVDLIKGIGTLAGLDVVEVDGATGLMDTDYEGKAKAALQVLEQSPFVLVHVEATDEMGHVGDEDKKTQAIRDFDQRMLGVLIQGLETRGVDFRLLLLPDHPTPIALRTHVNEPVPFLLYDSRFPQKKGEGGYSEESVKKRTQKVLLGHRVIDLLLEKGNYTDSIISTLEEVISR